MENSECILCGRCVDVCPKGVIKYSFDKKHGAPNA
jgi:ferredoxin-type protein NapH